MAAGPTVKVEINFSGSVWEDVTPYWDSKRAPITMTGGRQDSDDRAQPGRLTGLVLDNTDGRFTFGNPLSPYFAGPSGSNLEPADVLTNPSSWVAAGYGYDNSQPTPTVGGGGMNITWTTDAGWGGLQGVYFSKKADWGTKYVLEMTVTAPAGSNDWRPCYGWTSSGSWVTPNGQPQSVMFEFSSENPNLVGIECYGPNSATYLITSLRVWEKAGAGNIASGKRIRVSVKDPTLSTYYPRFTGSIDGWELSWGDNGATCWAAVSATDDLKKAIETSEAATGWIGALYKSRNWYAYWSFADNTATMVHAEVSGLASSMYPDFDSGICTEEGPPADPRLLPRGGAATAGWSTTYSLPSCDSDKQWQVGTLFKSSSTGTAFVPIRLNYGTTYVAVYITADGYLRVAYDTGGGWTTSGTGTVNICDDHWYYLSLWGGWDGMAFNFIKAAAYVPYPQGTKTPGLVDSAQNLGIPQATALAGVGSLRLQVGQRAAFGHVGYSRGTSTVTPTAFPYLGLGCAPVMTASEMESMYALMAPDEVDVTVNDPASGGSTLWTMYDRPVPETWSEWWEQVEQVDGGLLLAKRSGGLQYHPGYLRTSYIGSSYHHGRLDLTAEEIAEFTVATDPMKMCNWVAVEAKDNWDVVKGRTVLYDSTSITRSGLRAKSATPVRVYGRRSALHDAPNDIAADMLRPKEGRRVPSITVDVAALSDTKKRMVLGVTSQGYWLVDVWSRIAVTGLPTAGGFGTTWAGIVEGWSETVAIDQWSITFNTSFAGCLVGDSNLAKVGSLRLG